FLNRIPLHSCYRNGICSTNRLKYSWNLIKISMLSKLHSHFIIYRREFDIEQVESHYDSKLDYLSSHSLAIDAIRDNSKVLDIGCNKGYIDKELKRKGCYIVGIDCLPIKNKAVFDDFLRLNLNNVSKLPSMDNFDYILMLDIIEHLDNPELFLDKVREKSELKQPTVIITTPNIAFFPIRLQLLFSQFNYGKAGILDLSHKRLFTFGSIKKICETAGYKIKKMSGIPFPFPKALGKNRLSVVLLNLNRVLIFLSKKLFSYQIYIEIMPTPNVKELLKFLTTKDQYFIPLNKTGMHTGKKFELDGDTNQL
ncbi:MAG: class I SAM-dependent methyltransferase, partial [Cyanobacteria bacterium]|nr:class I SAM-dependent methyltransferase [Cyanobacteriota bacterium]